MTLRLIYFSGKIFPNSKVLSIFMSKSYGTLQGVSQRVQKSDVFFISTFKEGFPHILKWKKKMLTLYFVSKCRHKTFKWMSRIYNNKLSDFTQNIDWMLKANYQRFQIQAKKSSIANHKTFSYHKKCYVGE